VNILSVTYFGQKYDDTFSDNGRPIYIRAQRHKSIRKWDTFTRTIVHPLSNLPELPILPTNPRQSFATFVQNCAEICSCNIDRNLTYSTDTTGHCLKSAFRRETPSIDTSMITSLAPKDKSATTVILLDKVDLDQCENSTVNLKTVMIASKKVSWADIVASTPKKAPSYERLNY